MRFLARWGRLLVVLTGAGGSAVAASSAALGSDASGTPKQAVDSLGVVVVLRPLAEAVSPNTGEPWRISTGPLQWSMESGVGQARLGFALCAGDLDGDSWPELVLGAPGWTTPGTAVRNGGAVLIGRGWGAAVTWSVLGSTREDPPRSQFGRALAMAGNLRGISSPTGLLVGAPFYRSYSEGGACFLGILSPAGEWIREDPGLRGKSDRILFGVSLASAGDLNGDGVEDVAIGAFRATYRLPREGGVFIYPGSARGLVVDDPRWLWVGRQPDAYCGRALLAAGDVDQDGFDDLLVGLPGYDTDKPDAGRVCLVRGSATGPRLAPGWVAEGGEAYGAFGTSMAYGDVNADGRADVVVGAPGSEADPDLRGCVYVYLGVETGFEATPSLVLSDAQRGSGFGSSVALVRGLNGDRFADLLVGAPRYDGHAPNEGRVSLFLGRSVGFSRQPDWVVLGGQAKAGCGHTVVDAGDVNRDGLGDFLVGSPSYRGRVDNEGRVDLFYGSDRAYRESRAFPSNGTNSMIRPRPLEREFGGLSLPDSLPHAAEPGGARTVAWGLLATALISAVGWLWWHRCQLRAERLRIARDLHDRVGVHLVRLNRLGDRPEGAGPGDPGERADWSAGVEEVSEAMRTAVWSMDPRRGTLENLISFIGYRTERRFDGLSTRLVLDLPEVVPEMPVSARLREHLPCCVDEAVTNVLKHARARQAWLIVQYERPWLTVAVEDDGCGYADSETRTVGTGLANLRSRMIAAGGVAEIEARSGGGTRVTLRVKVR